MQVEVRSVSKSYADLVVLEEFSCIIRPGRVTALIGPSGSGKSTLLAAMAGFARIDSGEIMFVHADGRRERPHPQSVAWVPQGANALGGRTAIDNVMVSALAAGADLSTAEGIAAEQLDRVGLAHRARTAARHLSGGELQRVGFARALAAAKPLIFADEPTSSLDAVNTDQIARLLLSLRESATIVVATHDAHLIASAQDVIEIRKDHPDAH